MKNKKIPTKKLMPLLASLAVLSGPVLLVTACDHDISRYPAALPNDEQNRILFDFIGVNYSVNAKSQFSAALKQGIDLIKKDAEGIMAQQEFYNFFKKLGWGDLDKPNDPNDPKGPTKFEAIFTNIKDNLGLNLLANAYFSSVNSGQSFDSTLTNSNKLIFQTNDWHKSGTTEFEYSNTENPDDFYINNDPNVVFNLGNLYANPDDQNKDKQIIAVAKHADEYYNKDITYLTQNKLKWTGNSTNTPSQPTIGSDAVSVYQKKLQRFKWLLRFRYQQYYASTIEPQLNETLFSMANILDSILKVTTDSGKTNIQIQNSAYAQQLQSWDQTSAWQSNFRYTWEYNTTSADAENINNGWSSAPLPDLVKGTSLNPDFFSRLVNSDKSVNHSVDSIFGAQSYASSTTGKPYDGEAKNKANTKAGWLSSSDGFHYWGPTANRGIFAYTAPIYWIDDVLNLNFNFYNPAAGPADKLVIDSSYGDNALWTRTWLDQSVNPASGTDFSKYIRSDNNGQVDPITQSMKWNIFWQMLYSLADQSDSSPNKDQAAKNFTNAAKTLYPKYIKKENIYNDLFWNSVSSYYS